MGGGIWANFLWNYFEIWRGDAELPKTAINTSKIVFTRKYLTKRTLSIFWNLEIRKAIRKATLKERTYLWMCEKVKGLEKTLEIKISSKVQ